MNTVKT